MNLDFVKIMFYHHNNFLYRLAIVLMYLNFWLFGIHPFFKNYKIYEAFLMLWGVEIVWSTYLAFIYDVFGDEHSLNGLVSIILYFTHIFGHLVVLVESYKMKKYRVQLFDQFSQIRDNLKVVLQKPKYNKYNYIRFASIILGLLTILTGCHGIIMWTTFETKTSAGLLYWRSLLSDLALQFKTLEFLTAIIQLNYYIIVLRKTLNEMGERNLKRVFKTKSKNQGSEIIMVASIYEEQEDEQLLVIFKKSYNTIYAAFQIFNEAYGWCLLTSVTVYFVDLVCNTYWILLAILTQDRDYYGLMQNASFAILDFILLTTLCGFTEECNFENRVNMTFSYVKIIYYRHNNILYRLAIVLMYLNFWFFGIHPFFKNYKIYQAFLILWCVEIGWSTYLAIIYDVFGDEQSLNGFVAIILYFTHMIGHLMVLVESYRMKKYRWPLFEQFNKIKEYLSVELLKPENAQYNYFRFGSIIIGILMLLTCCHSTIMWTTFVTKTPAGLLYWRSLQSDLALQIKTLEFLTAIIQLKYYIILLRKALNEMGERNLSRVFKTRKKNQGSEIILVASVHQEKEDEQLLVKLKESYNAIYVAFQMYNEAYGWSLLTSTTVYFVDLVSNTYWILLAVLSQGRDYYGLMQNASFALLAFVLLTILCWFTDECNYESRYIGCIISKLVKPLGNKYYNDLVSEFSVQTLHQRFVITAKEFFTLNLSLLGSMVAAIVTYLVILIQFMFTEKSNNEARLTTPSPIMATTAAALNSSTLN